VIRLKSQQ